MAILDSLKDNLIDLHLDRVWDGLEEPEEGLAPSQAEELRRRTLRALTDLLCRAECVGNKNKLFTDLSTNARAPVAWSRCFTVWKLTVSSIGLAMIQRNYTRRFPKS